MDPPILDRVQTEFGFSEDKLVARRHILSEFGNMSSASVLFVMEEMRNRSYKEGRDTTGEGADWGALISAGPDGG